MSNYRIDHQQLILAFRALSNAHRLALFERLCRCCVPGTTCSLEEAMEVTVGDLSANLDLAPSTVSHHLKTLRLAGLICTERRGKQVFCWVEPDVLRSLSQFFINPLSPSREECCSGVNHVQV